MLSALTPRSLGSKRAPYSPHESRHHHICIKLPLSMQRWHCHFASLPVHCYQGYQRICERPVFQHVLGRGARCPSGPFTQCADHGLTVHHNVGKPLSAASWQAGSIKCRKTRYDAHGEKP